MTRGLESGYRITELLLAHQDIVGVITGDNEDAHLRGAQWVGDGGKYADFGKRQRAKDFERDPALVSFDLVRNRPLGTDDGEFRRCSST